MSDASEDSSLAGEGDSDGLSMRMVIGAMVNEAVRAIKWGRGLKDPTGIGLAADGANAVGGSYL